MRANVVGGAEWLNLFRAFGAKRVFQGLDPGVALSAQPPATILNAFGVLSRFALIAGRMPAHPALTLASSQLHQPNPPQIQIFWSASRAFR